MVAWLYSSAIVLTGEEGVGEWVGEASCRVYRAGFQELLSASGSVYSLGAKHGHSSVRCALTRQLGVFTSVRIPMSEVGRVQSRHIQSHKRAKPALSVLDR